MSQSSSSGGNPMTREDLLLRGSDWSLACDSVILNRLKDFSENLVKRSRGVTADCDSLLNDVDSLGFKVSNVTNQFLMLGNTLFVENCVQEFQECNETPVQIDSATVVESKAEKEAALIEKMRESIRIGVGIQRQRDELRTNGFEESSGSVDSRMSSSVNLAHLIGTSKFFSSKYCGLKDENRFRRPSKPESVASSSSNYGNSSVMGQVFSEPEAPTSPSPVLSEGTSYEEPNPSQRIPVNADADARPLVEEPPILSPHDALRKSLEEKLKFGRAAPEKREPYFFNDQARPPSPPDISSRGSSSLEDGKSSRGLIQDKIAESEPRSPSPLGFRPPPVMDMSDSDEEDMFKPVNNSTSRNLFDDFFKNQNQNIYQPAFIPSAFQPPPLSSEPPELSESGSTAGVDDDIWETEPVVPTRNHSEPVEVSGQNKVSEKTVEKPNMIPVMPPTVIAEIMRKSSGTASPAVRPVETSKPSVVPIVTPKPTEAPRTTAMPASTAKHTETLKSIVTPISVPKTVEAQKPVITPVTKPQENQTPTPSSTVSSQPSKRVSIFDSSDSDDDLFANLGSKKPPKTNLFGPPEPATKSDEINPHHIRPPPILDASSDSDNDIFASFSRKKPLFADRMSPPPFLSEEKLRENIENVNIFSPSVSEASPPKSTAVSQTPTTSKRDIFGDNNSTQSSGQTVTTERTEPQIATSSTFPTTSNHSTEQDNSSSHDQSFNNSVSSDSAERLPKQGWETENEYFRTETAVPENKPAAPSTTFIHQSSSSDESDIFESRLDPPPVDAEDDELQGSSDVAPAHDLFLPSSNSKVKSSDVFTSTEAQKPLEEAPKTVPQEETVRSSKDNQPVKAKSIFQSSDSDDDLFGGSSRQQKTTPTLPYASPLPSREPPPLPEPVGKPEPPTSGRGPTRVDLSDSDDNDIFKSLAKSSHVDMPKPVKVPSTAPTKGELGYPINQGKSAQVLDSLEDNLLLPKPPALSSKTKSSRVAASIFDSSDSDDDLFSPISKVKKAPSLRNFIQRSTAPPKSADVASKRSASLFGDSSDEADDDLFTGKGKTSASGPVVIESSRSVVTERPVQAQPSTSASAKPTAADSNTSPSKVAQELNQPIEVAEAAEPDERPSPEKSTDFSNRQRQRILRKDPESKERLFGAVARNLESILSAKLANSPTGGSGSVSLSSPVAPADVVSFDDQASRDNLLRCMTKDRPKILHRRRPPSYMRRQFSRNSESLSDKEMGPFV